MAGSKPFRISPDPRFLYLAPQHREVLSTCQYMISNKVGPVYAFAPIGSGKTSIARRPSFFIRHVYVTGADESYDRLKPALRAGIAEAAWSPLYSTRSYPFDPPETGKIAVKVINHYGDEVLKVYAT